jgi:leucyl/phenylalanyl-tRNA--protein transferase
MRQNRVIQISFTPEGIELAYRYGIFPMANSVTGDIYWCRPEPRAIIPMDGFHISRSLAKVIRQNRFEITFDTDFEGVMRCCADRKEGTWISEDFIQVYGDMHRLGKAHSVEAWKDGKLVGGTYGVSLGAAFMAESMFHYETNASKVALAALVSRLNARGYELLDVQYLTPHLKSLGAVEIPHQSYMRRLNAALKKERCFN